MTTAHAQPLSPNYDGRKRPIDMIVLHYTGMTSGAAALARLCDPEAKVSAHYLVEEDGTLFTLVDETQRAWHAGVSSWRGETDINDRSIGIEIVNPGHEWGYRPFPSPQIDAVVDLVRDASKRWRISPALVVGHSDVAPARKEDPGELFPWRRLADEGLAIAPYNGAPDAEFSADAALGALQAIGYDAPANAHAAAVLAFQRRFCPGSLGRGLDPLTKAAIRYASDACASALRQA